MYITANVLEIHIGGKSRMFRNHRVCKRSLHSNTVVIAVAPRIALREKKLWVMQLPADEMKKKFDDKLRHSDRYITWGWLTDWRARLPSDFRLQWRRPVTSSSMFPPPDITPVVIMCSSRNIVSDSTCRKKHFCIEWLTNGTTCPSVS